MKKTVAIFCGGSTYEHEVSIITGLQVIDSIDKDLFDPLLVYFDKNNSPFVIKNYKKKSDFKSAKRVPVNLTKLENGMGLVKKAALGGKAYVVDLVYLAFHGGTGESGPFQGFLELCKTPFTGPGLEGSVTSMNKALCKEVLEHNGIPQLGWESVAAVNLQEKLESIPNSVGLPAIIKPTHLGSSIGISIAKTVIELEQQLKLALQLDIEVLVEPALAEFTEYNVSVRSEGGDIQCSPIEEPVKTSETLSFEDKYENGGKKTGGAGMESLQRVLPAKIDSTLAEEIIDTAKKTYRAARLTGLVRIDFLYANNTLYCSEINPIPGSMSFYLWEAAGEQFQEQITQSLLDAEARSKQEIVIHPYETDIVDKFISS